MQDSNKENVASVGELVAPIDDTGVRTINVWTGKQFQHPEHGSLGGLTERYVQKLNQFVVEAGELSINQLLTRRFKYYQALSILHLPPDGSGRFLGDMDTMLQMAIAQNNPAWKVELISVTGWRVAHHESWIMREGWLVRDHLLNDIWDTMVRRSPELKGQVEREIGRDHIRGYDYRIDFFDAIWSRKETVDSYDAAMEEEMYKFLDILDEDNTDNWLNNFCREVIRRRPGNRHFRYHYSEEYGNKVSGIDAMVAAYRNSQSSDSYIALAQILTRSGVFDLDLIKRPEIPELLRFVMNDTFGDDKEMWHWILTGNRDLNRAFITRPFSGS